MDPNRFNSHSMVPTSSSVMFNPAAAFQSMFQNMAASSSNSSNPFETALMPSGNNYSFSNDYSGGSGQNHSWTSSSTSLATTISMPMPMMFCMMIPMTANLSSYPHQNQDQPSYNFSNQQRSTEAQDQMYPSNGANNGDHQTVRIIDEGPMDSSSYHRSRSYRDVSYESGYDEHYRSSQQVPESRSGDLMNYSSSASRDEDIEVIPRDRAAYEFSVSNNNSRNLRRISPSPLRSPVRPESRSIASADRSLDSGGLKSILKRSCGSYGQKRSGKRIRFNISEDEDAQEERFTLGTKVVRKGKRREDPVRKAPAKSATATSATKRSPAAEEDDGYINEDESDLDSLVGASPARRAELVPFRPPQVARPVTVVTIDDDGSESERRVTPLWAPAGPSTSSAGTCTSVGVRMSTCKDVDEMADECFEDNWVDERYVAAALVDEERETTNNDDAGGPSTDSDTPTSGSPKPDGEPGIRINPFETSSGPKVAVGLKTPRRPPPPPPPILRPATPKTSAAEVGGPVVVDPQQISQPELEAPVVDIDIEVVPQEGSRLVLDKTENEVFKKPNVPVTRSPRIPRLMDVVIEDKKVEAVAADTQKIRDSMKLISKNIDDFVPGKDPFKIIREVCVIMGWKTPVFFTRNMKLETIRGPETRYKVSATIGGSLLTPSKLELTVEKAQYRSAVFSINFLRNNFAIYMRSLGLRVPEFDTRKLIKRSLSRDCSGEQSVARAKMRRIDTSSSFRGAQGQNRGQPSGSSKLNRLKSRRPFGGNQKSHNRRKLPVLNLRPDFEVPRSKPFDRQKSSGGYFKGRKW